LYSSCWPQTTPPWMLTQCRARGARAPGYLPPSRPSLPRQVLSPQAHPLNAEPSGAAPLPLLVPFSLDMRAAQNRLCAVTTSPGRMACSSSTSPSALLWRGPAPLLATHHHLPSLLCNSLRRRTRSSAHLPLGHAPGRAPLTLMHAIVHVIVTVASLRSLSPSSSSC
jgi:hypothetical protein